MSSESKISVFEGWSKWQIAACVGAPIALGLAGIWLYKRKSTSKSKSKFNKTLKHSVNEKTIHEGGDSSATGSGKISESALDKISEPLTPKEKAQAAKSKGNKYFKGGKYDKAIECYTEAIESSPLDQTEDLATFYQNRAAAYEHLNNYAQVISDCTKALEFNNKYTKALFRRAKACEITKDLKQSLEDITAVCILESFENHHSLIMADRVLKDLGQHRAKNNFKNRVAITPSCQAIRSYFASFLNDPILNSLKNPNRSPTPEQEKYTEETQEKELIIEELQSVIKSSYEIAIEEMIKQKYEKIVALCTDEISSDSPKFLTLATLLRGTIYLLCGEYNKAISDFENVIKTPDVSKEIEVNALIKRGSALHQSGDQSSALDDFATASRKDPTNSDIFHHRGQLNLLIERYEDAVNDFDNSVMLSPEFSLSCVQKCYAHYRQALQKQSSLELKKTFDSFDKALEKFPNCSEGHMLHGQALCDQQQFQDADNAFKRALEIEPDNGNLHVHRGLLLLQWKQDIDGARSLIKKAIEVDEKCEFGYETLGTIEVQKGLLPQAIELFHKAIRLAKTESEMAHLYSLLDAAEAQSKVAEKLGLRVPTLS